MESIVANRMGMDERMNDTWTLPNGLRVIGALYHTDTGVVEFLE